MAKPNPLLGKRPLVPVGDSTQSDFLKRMAATNPLLNTATPGLDSFGSPFQSVPRGKALQGGAALRLIVDHDDKLPSDYAENKEPYENIAFGIFKQDSIAQAILVESKEDLDMHSGRFYQLLTTQLKMEDKETKPLEMTESPIDKEIEIYRRLIGWSKRLQKLFLMIQGLLAGLCMLHLYLLLEDTSSDETFVQSYARYTRVIATFFHALVLIAFIGALHRMLSERRHCNFHSDRRMEMTEIDYDVDKHKRPYYVAMVCSICSLQTGYGICYIFTIVNATQSNRMFWNFELDNVWATALSSSFKSDLKSWKYLCVIREILAIITWLIICSQGYWNVGSLYRYKIETMRQAPALRETRFVPTEVYKHLFFGNPYLPSGVFTIADHDETAKKEAEKRTEK